MPLSKTFKVELVGRYRTHEKDTGSPEVQVAILSERIQYMNEHLRQFRKDFASQRGLLRMVSRRRRLLDYMKRRLPGRYQEIIQRLGIRK